MLRNTQRHMLRHIVLLCHWLQYCKLGHGRRLRCAFASRNPSAVVANSCTHRRPPTPTRRDKTVSSRRRRRCVLGLKQTRQNTHLAAVSRSLVWRYLNISTNRQSGSICQSGSHDVFAILTDSITVLTVINVKCQGSVVCNKSSTAPTACVGNVDRRCSDHPGDVRPRPWNLPGWIAICRCRRMFSELCRDALRLCVSCARFVTPFQLPHSRRWWSHSSTPNWTTAIVCLLVSQLTSYGDYSLFLTRQHGLSSISDAPITSVMR